MKFFNMDSPLMQGLNKVADLMWLNILTILCCIPVVTVGASLTAMHYMALKIARNEETYITQGFFHSFRQNFKQATLVWLGQAFVIAVLAIDYYLFFFAGAQYHTALQVILFIVTVVVALTSAFLYPVLAKFENSISKTVKNAFFIGMLQLPKSIVILAMTVAPVFLGVYLPQILPLVLMFGLTLPAFGAAKLYNGFFAKLEEKVEENNPSEKAGDEDEHIFSDEPILPAEETK